MTMNGNMADAAVNWSGCTTLQDWLKACTWERDSNGYRLEGARDFMKANKQKILATVGVAGWDALVRKFGKPREGVAAFVHGLFNQKGNIKMSKFKVGDRVVFKDEGWRGRVVEIKSDGTHVVQFDGVGDYARGADYFREDQLARNTITSTNPVVQNALVANKSWDFKPGDKVRFEGHPYSTPFTVTAVRGEEVQLEDGHWYRATMFIARNSAARNAQKVRVAFKSPTRNGIEPVSFETTLDGFEKWMNAVCAGDKLGGVYAALAAKDSTSFMMRPVTVEVSQVD